MSRTERLIAGAINAYLRATKTHADAAIQAGHPQISADGAVQMGRDVFIQAPADEDRKLLQRVADFLETAVVPGLQRFAQRDGAAEDTSPANAAIAMWRPIDRHFIDSLKYPAPQLFDGVATGRWGKLTQAARAIGRLSDAVNDPENEILQAVARLPLSGEDTEENMREVAAWIVGRQALAGMAKVWSGGGTIGLDDESMGYYQRRMEDITRGGDHVGFKARELYATLVENQYRLAPLRADLTLVRDGIQESIAMDPPSGQKNAMRVEIISDLINKLDIGLVFVSIAMRQTLSFIPTAEVRHSIALTSWMNYMVNDLNFVWGYYSESAERVKSISISIPSLSVRANPNEESVREVLAALHGAIRSILQPSDPYGRTSIPNVNIQIVEGTNGELIFMVTSSNPTLGTPDDKVNIAPIHRTFSRWPTVVDAVTSTGEMLCVTFTVPHEDFLGKTPPVAEASRGFVLGDAAPVVTDEAAEVLAEAAQDAGVEVAAEVEETPTADPSSVTAGAAETQVRAGR